MLDEPELAPELEADVVADAEKAEALINSVVVALGDKCLHMRHEHRIVCLRAFRSVQEQMQIARAALTLESSTYDRRILGPGNILPYREEHLLVLEFDDGATFNTHFIVLSSRPGDKFDESDVVLPRKDAVVVRRRPSGEAGPVVYSEMSMAFCNKSLSWRGEGTLVGASIINNSRTFSVGYALSITGSTLPLAGFFDIVPLQATPLARSNSIISRILGGRAGSTVLYFVASTVSGGYLYGCATVVKPPSGSEGASQIIPLTRDADGEPVRIWRARQATYRDNGPLVARRTAYSTGFSRAVVIAAPENMVDIYVYRQGSADHLVLRSVQAREARLVRFSEVCTCGPGVICAQIHGDWALRA